MIKVACPCCGQSFSPEQAAELSAELAGYAPGGGGEPADEGQEPMEAKTMVEAMTRELEDPKKDKARKARKE